MTPTQRAIRIWSVMLFLAFPACGPTSSVTSDNNDSGGTVDSAAPSPKDTGAPVVDTAVDLGAPIAEVAPPPRDAPPADAGGPIATNDAGADALVLPPVGPPGAYARGVHMGLFEAAQGVFVKIGDGATIVAPEMRNAPLIEGRGLFVRAHVTTDAGFQARRLRGVLTVAYPDSTKIDLEDAKMISGPSNVERLETTFNFLVPADRVKAGITAVASIYESAAAAGADPTPPPRFPATDAVPLGVKAGRMELFVVAVPVGMLMDTPERRQKLTQDLYDLYPVQKVNLTMHAPITLPGAFSSNAGFSALRDLRTKENAKPYEYYHMLVGATNVGYEGIGNVPGPAATDGARRVAISIVHGNAIDGNTNTTAHEIGHNHGRQHAPGCGAAGPDANYPYKTPPGDSGVNGYSLSFSAFKSRMMFRDLMSYCRPRWISDYGWRLVEARVRIVTGYAMGAAMDRATDQEMQEAMASRSLQGFAGPGESPSWGIVTGQLVADGAPVTAARHAELTLDDGRVVTVPISVTTLTDDQTQEYAVNLSGGDFTDDNIVAATVVVDSARFGVPLGSLARP